MSSPWFNAAVVAFWLITTGWLVMFKVLPPVLVGTPPTYRTILDEQSPEEALPVEWKLYWDETAVGQATSTTERGDDGVTRLSSRVRLEDVPLASATPLDLGMLIDDLPKTLAIDAESVFEIDPLGKLIGFESQLRLGVLRDAIQLRGVVDGNQLVVAIRSGSFEYNTSTYLSGDSLVGDAMSPQAMLPGLRMNQAWTVPVYNPFLPLHQPMQVLHAKVEQEDYVQWNGELVPTWLVVYRADEGAGLAVSRTPRGRAWVRRDGMVLVQEATIFNSTLRFVRSPDANARAAARERSLGEAARTRDR